MKTIRTTCPYCGVGCGILATAEGVIKADPDHPSNYGRICSKGAALGETLGLEGRLLVPQINGQRTSWDKALNMVADRFQSAIQEHGPDSVAFYVSGQLLTEDYYIANKLMKGFIGSANIDTNSRLCMASSVAGHKRAFGADTVPGTYEDFEQADLIVLVGSNLAWCHPVLFQRILAAKAKRPKIKIISIDPRQSATSKAADIHLAVRPDGDTALFNGLLHEIAKRGAVDQNYVDAYVNGYSDALTSATAGDDVDCGLGAAETEAFYDHWIGTEKVVTVFSQGVNQSIGGSDKVNAIINCHLATGRIGRPGMGPFSVTGQPNAMGGREVGGLANMLACHLDIENSKHRSIVQNLWNSPNICTKPGLKAVDLFNACASGQIKALWIISTNPAVSMPNADKVASAIKNVEFSVISEVSAQTDSSVLTHVQLPATAWGEKTGTVTNSERRISLQRAFLPVPGEARPDWQILCDVAKRMGWADAFTYSNAAEIFREYASLSAQAAAHGSDFDIGELATISDVDYENFSPVQWPISKSRTKDQRFFANGGYFHADAKARMISVASIPAIKLEPEIYRLNSGRVRDQWHTMARSGKSPRLSQHSSEPFAEIHPADAHDLKLVENDLLEIKPLEKNTPSYAILRVKISAACQRGVIFAPMHWGSANSSAGRINALIGDECDPTSGQPALKGGQVRANRFNAQWHAFAASTAPMFPNRAYSAVARTKTGWSCELAGTEPVSDWETEARAVLNLTFGNASILQDAARGVTRVAIYYGTVLTGLYFSAPQPISIDRSHAIAQIKSAVPALTALAGLPMNDQPGQGRIVCACFNVGVDTIRDAIRQGAGTVMALGARTNAGTNCGSCKPELSELISDKKPRSPALGQEH